MVVVPIIPHLEKYRGSKEAIRLQTAEFNRMAQRIADYVNTLIANNPNETQVYMFSAIARDLRLDVDDVRRAISDGSYNGITVGVRESERRSLARYKNS